MTAPVPPSVTAPVPPSVTSPVTSVTSPTTTSVPAPSSWSGSSSAPTTGCGSRMARRRPESFSRRPTRASGTTTCATPTRGTSWCAPPEARRLRAPFTTVTTVTSVTTDMTVTRPADSARPAWVINHQQGHQWGHQQARRLCAPGYSRTPRSPRGLRGLWQCAHACDCRAPTHSLGTRARFVFAATRHIPPTATHLTLPVLASHFLAPSRATSPRRAGQVLQPVRHGAGECRRSIRHGARMGEHARVPHVRGTRHLAGPLRYPPVRERDVGAPLLQGRERGRPGVGRSCTFRIRPTPRGCGQRPAALAKCPRVVAATSRVARLRRVTRPR